MRIGDGLHRLANGTDATLIDAGVPGYWSDLPAELAAIEWVRARGTSLAA